MTDTQILTVVIAILASLGTLIYNNARITDVGKRIDDLRDSVNRRLDSMNLHIDDEFELLMERIQRMEDNITRQLLDHETRLQNLERNK